MRESPPLSRLRRQLAAIERQHHVVAADPGRVPTGHAAIDAVLDGGMMRARLHELFAAQAEDAAAVAGFAAMLARQAGGPVVWLRQDEAQRRGGGLYGPGLVDIGFDPGRLTIALLPDALAILKAAAEVVRCAAVGVAIIELWQAAPALDLTASRRLAMAAEQSGVTALMLRVAAEPAPSAAWTRWQVASAPSAPLEANAPGHPALDLTIMRQRHRPAGGRWLVEWNRDQGCFIEPGSRTRREDVPIIRRIGSALACAVQGQRAGNAAVPRPHLPLPLDRSAA
jgi:protein ImuA